jgi:hypothetical protein
MSLAATVLIPTHDHGPTLLRSVPSALAQTVTEIEVFVVGDGAPDVTRQIMADFTAADERIRFFDNPKGPRHGEIHRNAALQEARGEIVCYLSDDDLWLPSHVESMRELLAGADLVNALSFLIAPDSRLHVSRTDLSRDYYRELILGGEPRTHLSATAHTIDLYRRLGGWVTTPKEITTDLYFIQRLISVPGCVAASGSRPTVWNFPSGMRRDWTIEQRVAELDEWVARLSDPQALLELTYELFEATLPDRAWLEEELSGHKALVGELRGRVASLEHDVETRNAKLERIAASATWRLRGTLVRVPGLRWAAKALARPAAPAATEPARRAPRPEPSSQATGSPAPDPPSDSQARPRDPSTR